MTAIPKASAVDIVTQLVTGPSLQEVASKTLRDALKTLRGLGDAQEDAQALLRLDGL